jgi:hypothetical protein
MERMGRENSEMRIADQWTRHFVALVVHCRTWQSYDEHAPTTLTAAGSSELKAVETRSKRVDSHIVPLAPNLRHYVVVRISNTDDTSKNTDRKIK